MPRVCCLWPTSLPSFASIYVVIITYYVKTVVGVASCWSAPLCRFQMFFRDLALMLTYLFCFYKYKGLKGVFFSSLVIFGGPGDQNYHSFVDPVAPCLLSIPHCSRNFYPLVGGVLVHCMVYKRIKILSIVVWCAGPHSIYYMYQWRHNLCISYHLIPFPSLSLMFTYSRLSFSLL